MAVGLDSASQGAQTFLGGRGVHDSESLSSRDNIAMVDSTVEAYI